MDHRIKSEASGRGRILLAAAALLCFTVPSLYFSSNNISPLERNDFDVNSLSIAENDFSTTNTEINNDYDNRRLSTALANGGCQVTYAHLSKTPIPPTWQASFPGSGARMTWNLVEALTGIRSNNDYNTQKRGYERVVAVKTHYPVKTAKRKFPELDKLFTKAMVVLRNPVNAVPSYFNLQYEHMNHLPNHSTRGPQDEWIKYRDHPNHGLSYQMGMYEKFVQYWMERYPDRSSLLLISYEDLTDGYSGPIAAKRIANFLGQVEGVDPIMDESIPCVWKTIVDRGPPAESVDASGAISKRKLSRKKENPNPEESVVSLKGTLPKERETINAAGEIITLKQGKTYADPSSLRTGPKVRQYTAQNLAALLAMFERLVERYSHDEEFVGIMATYIGTVSQIVPSEE